MNEISSHYRGDDIQFRIIICAKKSQPVKPNIVPNDHSSWTALMAAAARGHAITVALLLQNGADPNIKSKDGRTAIELARAEGHSEVVRKFSAIGN